MNALVMENALTASVYAKKASVEPTAHKGVVRITALKTVHVTKQLTNATVNQATQAIRVLIRNAQKTATAMEYANSVYAIAPQNSQEQAVNISSVLKTAVETEAA